MLPGRVDLGGGGVWNCVRGGGGVVSCQTKGSAACKEELAFLRKACTG